MASSSAWELHGLISALHSTIYATHLRGPVQPLRRGAHQEQLFSRYEGPGMHVATAFVELLR